MLGSFGEITKYTFDTPAGRAKFELGARALARWPALLDELGVEPSARGCHVIANSRSGSLDDKNFRAIIAALSSHDGKWSEVDPSSIPGVNPLPTSRPMRAVFLPDEFGVEGAAVLDALASRFVSLGGCLLDGVVQSLVVGRDRINGCVLRDGRSVCSPKTVVAAGAFSQALLEQAFGLGATVPIIAGVGTAFTGCRVKGAPFETVVRTVTRAGSCGLHVVPLRQDREYIGATNVVFREPETHAGVGMLHFLLGCAIDQLDRDIFFHRVHDWKVGNRPVPVDMFPLLGRGPADGLYIAAGNYRDGFQCAPEISTYVAALLLDGAETFEHPFAPTRRPLFTGNVADAIEEFVDQCVSGGFEGGASLPGYIPVDVMSSYFHQKAIDVMSATGCEVGLPPDLLHFLALNRWGDEDLAWFRRVLGAYA
jgi:glycine/D-amino acid oxidase-like deaminating enzyme